MEVAPRPGLGTLETGLGAAARGAADRRQPRHAVDRVRAPALAAGPRPWPPPRARGRRIQPRRTPPRAAIARTAPSCWPARADRHPLQHRCPRRRRPGDRARRDPRAARARRGLGARRRDAPAAAGRAADGLGAGARRRGATSSSSTARWPGSSAAARSTPSSWAATAWPPTATPPTRSAPTRWRWPRGAAGIPFVVAGPTSTIDPRCPTATASRSRSATATRCARSAGSQTTLPGTAVRNPAFDVTPAALVTALVTERGVARPPDAASIAALLA